MIVNSNLLTSFFPVILEWTFQFILWPSLVADPKNKSVSSSYEHKDYDEAHGDNEQRGGDLLEQEYIKASDPDILLEKMFSFCHH